MVRHKFEDYHNRRSQLQSDGADYATENGRVLLSWATGIGKTKVALEVMDRIQERWHIVVPRINMIQGWKEQMQEHGYHDLLDRVERDEIQIYCYPSLGKYKIEKKDNMVLDEVHNLGTELRLSHMYDAPYDRLVCLSATVPEDRKKELEFLGVKDEWHIPLSKVVQWDILPKPKIYVVYDTLDRVNVTAIHEFRKGRVTGVPIRRVRDGQQWAILKNNKDVHLEVECTPYKKMQYVEQNIEFAKKRYMDASLSYVDLPGEQNAQYLKTAWLKQTLDRKRFINSQKQKMIEKMMELCNDQRTVYFMPSIAMCEELGTPDNQYHQNNSDGLDNFNEGHTNNLLVVDKINEGANLYRPNVGVITALGSKEEKDEIRSIQVMGRILRSEKPVIFVIVMRGTQDEVYLKRKKSFFDKFDTQYIDHRQIDAWIEKKKGG